MPDVLVDTSIWIDAFRGANPTVKNALDSLLAEDRVVFCGVVEMELLHGIRPKETLFRL
jgi:predicted nucleic acid-binding protein